MSHEVIDMELKEEKKPHYVASGILFVVSILLSYFLYYMFTYSEGIQQMERWMIWIAMGGGCVSGLLGLIYSIRTMRVPKHWWFVFIAMFQLAVLLVFAWSTIFSIVVIGMYAGYF